jgi:CBS domain-containing protein
MSGVNTEALALGLHFLSLFARSSSGVKRGTVMSTPAMELTGCSSSIDLLEKLTAADLMTTNPVSLRRQASVAEAITLFTDRAFTGAAVIDDRGRPVGVLSSTDVLIHDREKLNCGLAWSGEYTGDALSDRVELECMGASYRTAEIDRATVGSIMTPAVFSVRPETTARKVMEQLVAFHVHRVFVIDEDDVLIGVISALDVMKGLLQAL